MTNNAAFSGYECILVKGELKLVERIVEKLQWGVDTQGFGSASCVKWNYIPLTEYGLRSWVSNFKEVMPAEPSTV